MTTSNSNSNNGTNMTEAYKTEKRPNLVACYGSLMTGLGNNRVMQIAEGELIGTGKLKNTATMFSLTGFPALQLGRPADDASCPVVEVYRVSEEGLKPLNRLEGFYGKGSKSNFYDCSEVEVILDETGEELTASVYHIEREFDTVVVGGDWRKYLEDRAARRDSSEWEPDFS